MIIQILILLLDLWLSGCHISEEYFPKKCTQLSFVPMPHHIECNLLRKSVYIIDNPCQIKYHIETSQFEREREHLAQLILDQQQKTFRCRQVYLNTELKDCKNDYHVMIELKKANLQSAFTTKQQAYQLQIDQHIAKLKANYYTGFVRGLQTFLQSITCNKLKKMCYMMALPIRIEDEPVFEYRGLLVDTSRHFIPMQYLYQTIDAMMYSKLNIFHWHVVDQDSFPLELESHPELAQYASFSTLQTYGADEVQKLIKYAMIRGVRIIPQIDTPGHAYSWSKSPQNSDIACNFSNRPYQGSFDVTLDKTYKIMVEVFKQIFQVFPDPLVHLGGDEVVFKCFANKTEFLQLEQIEEDQIQMQYRKKQKKMLKQLNTSKVFIYWMYDNITPIDEEDIMHWWGKGGLVPPKVENRKIIISWSKGPFYIDMGAGTIRGTPYHNYSTWMDLYTSNIAQQIANTAVQDKVLGAEVTLWGQVSNMHTLHTKIWIRSCAFAERLWTAEEHTARPDVLRRLTAHERLINRRGIPTTPVTCRQCENNPELC